MIIGVDFDNTIVSYDVVFHRAAVEQELIPPEVPADKSKIRDYLRWVNKEDAWTELQGLVYGVYIKYAPPFSGVKGFFRYCKENKISICIISHKTRFPFLGKKHNLHKSAVRWFEDQGFFDSDTGLSRHQVYFESTKEKKLKRIVNIGCTHYIDDLPEFLEEANFPNDVERILFDPNNIYQDYIDLKRITTWKNIRKIITD